VFIDVDGVTMQGPLARLSRTPGRVSHAAPGFVPAGDAGVTANGAAPPPGIAVVAADTPTE
jgi:hypothetical protein